MSNNNNEEEVKIIIKPKTISYYNLTEIMNEMEKRGFMSKKKSFGENTYANGE